MYFIYLYKRFFNYSIEYGLRMPQFSEETSSENNASYRDIFEVSVSTKYSFAVFRQDLIFSIPIIFLTREIHYFKK